MPGKIPRPIRRKIKKKATKPKPKTDYVAGYEAGHAALMRDKRIKKPVEGKNFDELMGVYQRAVAAGKATNKLKRKKAAEKAMNSGPTKVETSEDGALGLETPEDGQ